MFIPLAVIALSATSAQKPAAPPPAPAPPQQASQPAQQDGTITCPLTGEQIPPCCCPVKK